MLKMLSQLIVPQKPKLVGTAARRDRLVMDPPYPTVYAVGDVHGSYSDLLEAEDRIFEDAAGIPGDKVILYLGDLVDRGPESAHVLDHMTEAAPDGFFRFALCGNHEEAMLSFLNAPSPQHPWLLMGGEQTLQSYGLSIAHLFRSGGQPRAMEILAGAIPPGHRSLLEGLPVMIEGPGVVFVHAGIHPGVPLSEQTDVDCLWIREPFLTAGPGFPIIVVHGHTPHELPSIGRGRVGIDTLARGGMLTILRWAHGRFHIVAGPDRSLQQLSAPARRAGIARPSSGLVAPLCRA